MTHRVPTIPGREPIDHPNSLASTLGDKTVSPVSASEVLSKMIDGSWKPPGCA